MPKNRKITTAQKIVIVSLGLILVQAIYLFIFAKRTRPVPFMEMVNQSVNQIPGLDAAGKETAKVEMAIMDYMANNLGRAPKSLDELIPKYFDRVPVDPNTKVAFKYRVEGSRFILGEEKTAVAQAKTENDPNAPISKEEADKLLLASVTGQPVESTFVYDSKNKRDPFAPFDLSPKQSDDATKTPLERVTFSQMKLTAVLGGIDEPYAIVELEGGRGYPVRKGTKIGPNGGEVIEIQPSKILILETAIDFTGEKKTSTVELHLRTKPEEKRN